MVSRSVNWPIRGQDCERVGLSEGGVVEGRTVKGWGCQRVE